MKRHRNSHGFTVIELLVVIVILCILATLVALTYSGVQSKNRNAQRKADIDTLKGQLETYYAQTNVYPTYANINNDSWRTTNLKRLKTDALQDPSWRKSTKGCVSVDKPGLAADPTVNCYSYQVTGTDGSACDNVKTACAHYTLTAMLEGGEKYVKTSLN